VTAQVTLTIPLPEIGEGAGGGVFFYFGRPKQTAQKVKKSLIKNGIIRKNG